MHPSSKSLSLAESLDRLISRYQQAHGGTDVMLMEYDHSWPSECYLQSAENGQMVAWRPVRQADALDFSGVSRGLNMTLHPDIETFYGRYWSDNLSVRFEQQNIELLQVINSDDATRLQQNLIGHVLMKQRLKQPATLFLGLTEQEDQIITLDNHSGSIMLERVGLQSKHQLAPSLSEFIDSLTV